MDMRHRLCASINGCWSYWTALVGLSSCVLVIVGNGLGSLPTVVENLISDCLLIVASQVVSGGR